jgi:hypothetical protein
MYSSTHSLTSALDVGEWSASRLTPGDFQPIGSFKKALGEKRFRNDDDDDDVEYTVQRWLDKQPQTFLKRE